MQFCNGMDSAGLSTLILPEGEGSKKPSLRGERSEGGEAGWGEGKRVTAIR